MNNIYADLHSHTTYSDGKLSVSELIEKAKSHNIKVFSITDHDTISAYNEDINGIKILYGVELTVYFNSKEIHLLAYNFDKDNFELNTYLDSIKEQRANRAKNIINQLRNKEIDISFDEIYNKLDGDIITRSHIADELIEKKYAKNVYEVFTSFLSTDNVTLPKVNFIDFEDAIKLVRNAGGFVSLAHPNKHFTQTQLYNMIKNGMRCIELYHPSHNFYTLKNLTSFARQYQLNVSGGSDYHGKYYSEEKSIGHFGLTEEQFERLNKEFKLNLV